MAQYTRYRNAAGLLIGRKPYFCSVILYYNTNFKTLLLANLL